MGETCSSRNRYERRVQNCNLLSERDRLRVVGVDGLKMWGRLLETAYESVDLIIWTRTGSSGNGNELSLSMKDGEFIDQPSD